MISRPFDAKTLRRSCRHHDGARGMGCRSRLDRAARRNARSLLWSFRDGDRSVAVIVLRGESDPLEHIAVLGADRQHNAASVTHPTSPSPPTCSGVLNATRSSVSGHRAHGPSRNSSRVMVRFDAGNVRVSQLALGAHDREAAREPEPDHVWLRVDSRPVPGSPRSPPRCTSPSGTAAGRDRAPPRRSRCRRNMRTKQSPTFNAACQDLILASATSRARRSPPSRLPTCRTTGTPCAPPSR